MGKRLTYEFVKEQFEKEGYELLSGEYVDSKTKLDYRCPKGHERNTTWAMWQQNRRCSICSREKGIAKRRVSLKFIKSQFEKEGYELLSKEYKTNTQRLKYICTKGHKHNVSWSGWKNGNRCPYCYGNGKLSIEFIKFEFAKEDYKLLTKEYKNSKEQLDYICPKGHKYNITWGSWQRGSRCSYCNIMASKGEIEVRNFIKSLGIKVSPNNRSQIFNPETGNGFELDIFMPNLNKAIEYNGEYWHRDKDRDLFKRELCESKNINLLVIWDKEWLNESEKCKNRVMKFVFNNERGI